MKHKNSCIIKPPRWISLSAGMMLSILWLGLVFYAIMQWESRATLTLLLRMSWQHELPDHIAKWVTFMTADPRVASLISAVPHTFIEIDREIISTAILLPSADLRRVISYKQQYVHKVLVNLLVKLAQEKSVVR